MMEESAASGGEDASHSGFAQTRKHALIHHNQDALQTLLSNPLHSFPNIPVAFIFTEYNHKPNTTYFNLFKCEVMFCLGLTKPG